LITFPKLSGERFGGKNGSGVAEAGTAVVEGIGGSVGTAVGVAEAGETVDVSTTGVEVGGRVGKAVGLKVGLGAAWQEMIESKNNTHNSTGALFILPRHISLD